MRTNANRNSKANNTNSRNNNTIDSRTRLVFRMMLVVTAVAMLGCRRATASRSVATTCTAFVTRTNTRTNNHINKNFNNNNNRATAFATTRYIRLLSSSNDGYDDSGRRVRTPRPSSDWDDDNDWGKPSSSDNKAGSDRSDSRSGSSSTRSTSSSNDSWDDFDPWQEPKQQQQRQPQRRSGDFNNDDKFAPRDRPPPRQRDFNDDDDWGAPRDRPRREQSGGGRFGSSDRGRGRGGGRGTRRSGGRGGGRGGDRSEGRGRGRGGGRDFQQQDRRGSNTNRFDNSKNNKDNDSSASRSINMNSLEGAGFVHLYGLSSVLNALTTGRRDIVTSMEKTDDPEFDGFDEGKQGDWGEDDNGGDDFAAPRRSSRKEIVKPQAQFRPYLFVQERSSSSGSDRRGSKASAAQEVLKLAEERDVPIAYVDKGILNVLSGNRPHQGFALRCGKLYFDGLSRIPLPSSRGGDSSPSSPTLWLVLDEVVDPQNLGALLRSAYFLGGKSSGNNNNIGVLVCSKNSAPPSPVVSASSAGALEVVDVHSTSNLPRTLNQAKEDGFRIIGASASVPSTSSGTEEDLPPPLYDLQDLPVRNPEGDDRPILLVLGSEGHGLRTLVAKACTEFVRIPSGIGGVEQIDDDDDDISSSKAGVDSLNVSVSAGIMLWHLLHGTSGK